MNRNSTIKKARKHYTLVEILMVIGLMAILMGIGTAGFNAITTKRGVNGGVSIVSSQINLARSVAVAKNSYIALLLPAPDVDTNPESSSNSNSKHKDRFLRSMRLCYVKRTTDIPASYKVNFSHDFEFVSWVEDHYWVDLPAKVCANFVDGTDYADISSSRGEYEVKNIIGVPNISAVKGSCFGIIFNPNGSLVASENALVQVYPGIIKPDGSLEMLGLGGSAWKEEEQADGNLKYRRWCVEINYFTGRGKTTYAQVKK